MMRALLRALVGLWLVLLGAVWLLVIVGPSPALAQVPDGAKRYRADLIRAAQSVWGLDAPITLLAAQVHQESAWRADACSPYACGLTQFTPDTATWIQRLYGVELGDVPGRDRRFDPRWALRAQARYMRHLEQSLGGESRCAALLFALSGYNGGPGWVARDRKVAQQHGGDPLDYWEVSPWNSGRAPPMHRENRDYPKRIVFAHQAKYAAWGRPICMGPDS